MTPTRARLQVSFAETGKPRLAVAPPGSSVAWTAASPAVAAPTRLRLSQISAPRPGSACSRRCVPCQRASGAVLVLRYLEDLPEVDRR